MVNSNVQDKAIEELQIIKAEKPELVKALVEMLETDKIRLYRQGGGDPDAFEFDKWAYGILKSGDYVRSLIEREFNAQEHPSRPAIDFLTVWLFSLYPKNWWEIGYSNWTWYAGDPNDRYYHYKERWADRESDCIRNIVLAVLRDQPHAQYGYSREVPDYTDEILLPPEIESQFQFEQVIKDNGSWVRWYGTYEDGVCECRTKQEARNELGSLIRLKGLIGRNE